MCKQDSTWKTQVNVTLAHPRKDGVTFVGVDPCIAPLVQAINDAGIQTASSCCGHGHQTGSIILEDGREILIAPDWHSARKMRALFPNIQGEWRSEEHKEWAEEVDKWRCHG